MAYQTGDSVAANTFMDPDLVGAILDLRQGDHLCLVYDDDPSEQLAAILPFLRQGLKNGEQCVYVADDHTMDAFRLALSEYGIDVEAEEARQALLLWGREQWRQPGDLDSDRKADQVRAVVDKALAAGFSGVRFGVEMTWTLGPDINAEKLRHWEATINTIFTPDMPGRIICQYSRRRLSSEVIHAGLCTHPIAVIGTEVCTNPFYEGPLLLQGRSYGTTNSAPEQVDWLISQLRWARAYDREREQRLLAEASLAEAQRTSDLQQELERIYRQLRESDEDLRDFFENGAIALHWVGPDGTILRANQAELDLLGYSSDEYLGHNIGEFHVDRPVIEDILACLTSHEILHDRPARLRCKDGSIRHVLIDSSVLWRNDEFVHTRCFTRDVTAKRLADATAQRLSAIVESSDDAIVSKDLDGIIQSWNPGAERLFGYTEDEAIGRSIRMLIPADRQQEEDDVLRHIRSGEKVDHFDTVRQRKDGSLVDISLTISPVKDGAGEIIGASKVARDITDRKTAERAVNESMTIKDQFIGLVSHELRTPIATILGNTQLLIQRGDRLSDENKRQSLTDVLGEARRLERIVENLLLLSRMDTGRELRTEPVSLPLLVESVVSTILHRSTGHGIATAFEPDLPTVLVEPTLVSLLLENLVGNAAKYSPADAAIEVSVRCNNAGDPEVSILDRGIGIEEADAEKLFTAFYRSKEATQWATGMGLGLAVCSRIVQAHGGEIRARRREGGGSIFSFTLPHA